MGIDLDEEGIAVVPIYGTHFASYAKLFGPGGIKKKCAILTDGDLSPSDADPNIPAEEEEEDPSPSRQNLDALRGPYVEIFTCESTFEREITLHGTLGMLEAATREVGAPRLAATIKRLKEESDAGNNPDLSATKDRVLRTANRFGKARYAQVISKHVSTAREIPDYIRSAVEWLDTNATN
jgi:putative ATP-dependent endonuclease of OLD family